MKKKNVCGKEVRRSVKEILLIKAKEIKIHLSGKNLRGERLLCAMVWPTLDARTLLISSASPFTSSSSPSSCYTFIYSSPTSSSSYYYYFIHMLLAYSTDDISTHTHAPKTLNGFFLSNHSVWIKYYSVYTMCIMSYAHSHTNTHTHIHGRKGKKKSREEKKTSSYAAA